MKFQEKLDNLNACSDAINWCNGYPSPQKAWDACERADWSLWIIGKLSGEPGSEKRKKLVLCTCEIARLALKFVPEGETRPLKAIETAEKFAGGDKGISLQNVRNAADAAASVASVAYVADAAYAVAYAAYAAAYAAYAAAYAAYAAADVADAAAYAASRADDAANAKKEMQIKCAEIVRKHYPKAPRI